MRWSIRRTCTSTSSPPSSPKPRPRRSTTPSACATPTATGSGCARAASWCSSRAKSRPHLIGIAVDITEQKTLVEKTVEADLRLRDAIETIPEAFVLWDANNRLVLCNSNFQALHNLPDEAVQGRDALRRRRRRRAQAGGAHQGDQRGPAARRAHLRGAARGRPLAAHQRAPHQGRRLRVGRHRHHHHQAARREADGARAAADEDDRRPARLAAHARASGRRARRPRARNIPRRRPAPRRPTRRSRASSPI